MNVVGLVVLVAIIATVVFVARWVKGLLEERNRRLPDYELWRVVCQAGTQDVVERTHHFIDTFHRSIQDEPLVIWRILNYDADPNPDLGTCEVETLIFGLAKAKAKVGAALLRQHFEGGKIRQLDEEDHLLYAMIIAEWQRRDDEARATQELLEQDRRAKEVKEVEVSEIGEMLTPPTFSVPAPTQQDAALEPDIHSRPLPEIPNASAYVLLRGSQGERASFLPLRTVEKNNRPLSDVFAAYTHLQEGQIGVFELVLKALPTEQKRVLWQNDRAFFRGDIEDAGGNAPVFKAIKGFFKGLITLGRGLDALGRMMHGQAPRGGSVKANDKAKPEKKARSQAESENEEVKEREAKSNKKLFETTFYLGVIAPDEEGAQPGQVAREVNRELAAQVLGILEPETSQINDGLQAVECDAREMIAAKPRSATKTEFLMSGEEIAAIAHPVDDLTNTHGIKTERMRLPQWPKPDYLPTIWKPGRFSLGYKGEHQGVEPVYMTFTDLLGGLAVSGASRNGKTAFVQHLIMEALRSHIPVTVFDPHMTLVRGAAWLTAFQHPELLKDKKVCWLDFTDRRYPPRFNPFAAYDDITEEAAIQAALSILSEMVAMDKLERGKAYIYEAVANLVHINRLLVQTEAEKAEERAQARREKPGDYAVLCRRAMRDGSVRLRGYLDLPRYFTDEDFCRLCMESTDEIEKSQQLMDAFWEKEPKARDDIIGPLLWRFKEITKSRFFRAIVGSPQNTIDFTELIDDHSVILIGASILGSRSEIGKAIIGPLVKKYLMEHQLLYEANGERPTDSLLIVDEAPVVANASAREMSAAADQLAKIGLRLVLIYQRLEQMYKKPGGDILSDAIKGFANRIAFKGSPADADCVFAGLDPKRFSKDELYTLYRYYLVARLTTTPQGEAPRIENPFVLLSPYPDRPDPTKRPEGDPEKELEWDKCELVVDELIDRGHTCFCWSAAEAEDAIRESYDRALDDLEQLKRDRAALEEPKLGPSFIGTSVEDEEDDKGAHENDATGYRAKSLGQNDDTPDDKRPPRRPYAPHAAKAAQPVSSDEPSESESQVARHQRKRTLPPAIDDSDRTEDIEDGEWKPL
jgi:hypothetical protein